MPKKVSIIGAGPAGLTAALEILLKSDYQVDLFDSNAIPGGISRTENYKGNKIDIGGHRFFSQSTRIMNWWKSILPLQGRPTSDDLRYRPNAVFPGSSEADPEKTDPVMLIRPRVSHIYFLNKFFDYPLSLSASTLAKLGFFRTAKIVMSYSKALLFRQRQEQSLEDFFINRFGSELYAIFFKEYTEKVWGVPCSAIRPEWGAQRINKLSIAKGVADALRQSFGIRDNHTESTLIRQFLYPKFGPGQLWSMVADKIAARGGRIRYNCDVTSIALQSDTAVNALSYLDKSTGISHSENSDYIMSSMPIQDLIAGLSGPVPDHVSSIAQDLHYRDFITVGVLFKNPGLSGIQETVLRELRHDTWMYIQDRSVQMGRIQIFNNWSPYLVHNPDTLWMGLEYFCQEGDSLWNKPDAEFAHFAIDELRQLKITGNAEVLDTFVIHEKKAYPAYTGSYDKMQEIRKFTDRIGNLFLIGRNGMHRYNNMDHSMMSAWAAVEALLSGSSDKTRIWNVNTEEQYQETEI
jgi:protoporphyrinogen oxidase